MWLLSHTLRSRCWEPLGDEFVSGFVEKKLLGRLQKTVDSLVDFEDSQAASYLLRVSYSIVRAVHFMRTTPLEKWRDQAAQFDRMIRRAIENILGFPMSDFTFAQACLTPKLGGLGTQLFGRLCEAHLRMSPPRCYRRRSPPPETASLPCTRRSR